MRTGQFPLRVARVAPSGHGQRFEVGRTYTEPEVNEILRTAQRTPDEAQEVPVD